MDKKVIIGSIASTLIVLLLCFVMCDGDSSEGQPGGAQSPNNKPFSKEQLETEFASGVVLICNSTYYTITFKNVLTLYFTELDDNGNIVGLTLNEDEVAPVIKWGTGFFVSKDGMIATNSHVAAQVIDQSSVRSIILNELASETDKMKTDINNYNEKIATLNISYNTDPSVQTRNKIDKLRKDRDELQTIINGVSRINSAEYSVNVVSQNFVAFNDTYVTNMNDLRGCHLLINDPESDLAVIQLGGDKRTPEGRHVFELDGSTKMSTDEPLYIIGFNQGPDLAATSVGIKAQITEGKLGQDRGDDFVHTIPTASGSSGSPIVNKHGKVVGINYAMLKDAQDFKFGVKVKFLIELINKVK